MKFKKDNPITSVDELIILMNSDCIFYHGDKIRFSYQLKETSFGLVCQHIENRNFFYAVEDDE